jgi:hypothetical protein
MPQVAAEPATASVATTGGGDGDVASTATAERPVELPAPRAAWLERSATRLLLALVLLVRVPTLLRRPGFVLDDWVALRDARADGVLALAGDADRAGRPGAAVVDALVFGVIGRHALVVLALLVTIGACTAVLLHRLARRYLSPTLAFAAAACWVALPNHTATEVWASETASAVATAALVGGLVLVGSPRDSWRRPAGLVLLAVAVLCYPVTLVLAVAGLVVLPWLAEHRVDRRLLAQAAIALGVPVVWALAHGHQLMASGPELADMGQAMPAQFGWGVAPSGAGARLLLVVALVGIGVAVFAPLLRTPRPQWDEAELAALAGIVIVVLGTLPFLRDTYAPLGVGDRTNTVASIGGALSWAALGALAVRYRSALLGAGLVVVVVVASARWERADRWHRAGEDAVAIVAAIHEQIPEPDGTIVVGPGPVQEGNVAAYVSDDQLTAALQLEYGDDDVRARFAVDELDFDATDPALRFDQRVVARLRSDD